MPRQKTTEEEKLAKHRARTSKWRRKKEDDQRLQTKEAIPNEGADEETCQGCMY